MVKTFKDFQRESINSKKGSGFSAKKFLGALAGAAAGVGGLYYLYNRTNNQKKPETAEERFSRLQNTEMKDFSQEDKSWLKNSGIRQKMDAITRERIKQLSMMPYETAPPRTDLERLNRQFNQGKLFPYMNDTQAEIAAQREENRNYEKV